MSFINLRLQNYRSYTDESFEFSPEVNIVVGPNASGKSNLLEAILVLSCGFSYRAKDDDLIRLESAWARLDGRLEAGNRTLKLERSATGLKKTYDFDGQSRSRFTARQTVPAVLFEPNHLLLLHGQPDSRRQFLDDLIEKIDPSYGSTRTHYKRALSQRNALLKRQPKDLNQQIFVWDLRLSELGGRIAQKRLNLVEQIDSQINELYKNIAKAKTKISINYVSRLPIDNYETSLLKKLNESIELDKLRGFTAYGPHRDDIELKFDGVTAPLVASRGETRTALLALKIFELKLLETASGRRPILLLDDVFSELDGRRRHALTDYLKKYQSFVTTTDADLITQNFAQKANLIALK